MPPVHQQASASNVSAEIIKEFLKKKKRKGRPKKFTELLQVTGEATKETKTTVENLKAKKLSEFISLQVGPETTTEVVKSVSSDAREETPVIVIGEDSVKFDLCPVQIAQSAELFKVESAAVLPEEVEEEHMVEKLEELETVEEHAEEEIEEPLVVAKETKEKKHSWNQKYHRNAEEERLHRQKSLAITLGAYLEVCVTNGMVNRGLSTILSYRYRSKHHSNSPSVLNVSLFNILLNAYAEKGDLARIQELLGIMREDRINFSPQTFAAVFECLGRLPDSDENRKLIELYHKEAVKGGITLNDIMDKSKFVGDKREMVLSVLQSIDPTFTPVYTPPPILYANHLVASLNESVRPVEECIDPREDMPGSEVMRPKAGFQRDTLAQLTQQQLNTELDGYLTVRSIEQFPPPTPQVLYARKKLAEAEDLWRAQFLAAFSRDLNSLRSQVLVKGGRLVNLFPYLKALDARQYAEIMLNEIRIFAKGSEAYSPTVNVLYALLGERVETRYRIKCKRENGVLEKTGEVYGAYCDYLSECRSSDNPRQCWQRIVHQTRGEGPSMDLLERSWPRAAKLGVGKFLYKILLRDLQIDVNCLRTSSKTANMLPAFYTVFRNQMKKVTEEVKPHPAVFKLFRAAQVETLKFEANMVPMTCPPRPWTSAIAGGYLLAHSDLLRLPHHAKQQLERVTDTPPENLYPALDSLNQLAAVPWQINTDVLDIVLAVFNSGGSAELEVPQPSGALKPPPELEEKRRTKDMTKEERSKMFRSVLAHKRRRNEMHSLWCDALYRLSLANHFRDRVFWLPHNMDFRGRVYPIPPHLSHLGNDLARSLLQFHQAQPLGVDGFSWLKLHCINLTGLKKNASVRERLLFAEQVMDDILDSADQPLTGRRWWLTSDDPWQTLAACIEIAKVARCPDPAAYLCRFPVHQDGSCNGLQHYAALGRDAAGAFSVNLAQADRPQDVYSAVARLVEETRRKDADAGVEIARVLDGYVRRKTIKQTVMTTVYGVTRYGARLQIARQLRYLDEFPKEHVWQASAYLTAKTFESLCEMFTSTREIQDWFTGTARLISGVCSRNVEWVTPLGLPIVQPYNRDRRRNEQGKGGKLSEHFSMDTHERPNIMKQKNAFPPNFIHSLDASHMMLTSLHCERAGITFVSVHDCFWTHPSTVPDMNKITRQQFVALHSEPILEDLSRDLIARYGSKPSEIRNDGTVVDLQRCKLNRILRMVPPKGDFDLRNVLDSVYFFS